MSAEQRAAVAAEAWAWVGTPYHHHARIKGLGVDCAQILAAVYEAAGLVPCLDLGNYAQHWHLSRSEELYLGWLERVGARRVEGAPQAGDIGVWQFGRCFSHGGIVVEGGADPTVVHAYIGRGVIVSRVSEDPLQGRAVQYWSIIE